MSDVRELYATARAGERRSSPPNPDPSRVFAGDRAAASAYAQCREVFSDAVAAALGIEPGCLEGDSTSSSEACVQRAREAVQLGRAALGVVLERAETFDSPLAERAGDAAFMGRFALGQFEAELERANLADRAHVARLVDKARRELLRALRNAEVLMCRLLGVPPITRYHYDELKIALDTRRAYWSLQRGAERTHGRDLWENLRVASNSLAKLCGRDVFYSLRIYDRAAVLKLRRHMRRLFVDASRGETDDVQASRALGEYHNFVEIAQEVNKRPELIEHDRVLLTRLQRDWQDQSLSSLRAELANLCGRDSRLDQALERGDSADALERIVDELLQTLGGQASAHWVAAADMRSA